MMNNCAYVKILHAQLASLRGTNTQDASVRLMLDANGRYNPLLCVLCYNIRSFRGSKQPREDMDPSCNIMFDLWYEYIRGYKQFLFNKGHYNLSWTSVYPSFSPIGSNYGTNGNYSLNFT